MKSDRGIFKERIRRFIEGRYDNFRRSMTCKELNPFKERLC